MIRVFTILFVLSTFLNPALVYARSVTAKKAIVVGKAAAYGLGGGLVIGLASQVLKSETKNIFVGGSIGMYAGILTGLYLVLTAQETQEFEGPDTYEDFQGWDSSIWESKNVGKFAVKESKIKLNLLELNF